jgi:hypothetical protein
MLSGILPCIIKIEQNAHDASPSSGSIDVESKNIKAIQA